MLSTEFTRVNARSLARALDISPAVHLFPPFSLRGGFARSTRLPLFSPKKHRLGFYTRRESTREIADGGGHIPRNYYIPVLQRSNLQEASARVVFVEFRLDTSDVDVRTERRICSRLNDGKGAR